MSVLIFRDSSEKAGWLAAADAFWSFPIVGQLADGSGTAGKAQTEGYGDELALRDDAPASIFAVLVDENEPDCGCEITQMPDDIFGDDLTAALEGIGRARITDRQARSLAWINT